MQVVPSTLLALLLVIALFVKGPYSGLGVFLATMPFGVAAAFNLPAAGGASIMVMDLATVAMLGALLLERDAVPRLLGSMRPGLPGFVLLLLTLFCILAAVLLPRIFAGMTDVFGLARSNNQVGIISITLHPTTGNLTQLFRILLDALVFFVLATVLRDRPVAETVLVAVSVATGVHVVLGWLDVLTGATGLTILMEPIRTANYAILSEGAMAGLRRMIGGFSEASSFGYFTLGLFGFWLKYWIVAGPSRRTNWALAMTTIVLLRSTSSSAYVGMIGVLISLALLSVGGSVGRPVGRRNLSLFVWSAIGVWFVALVLGGAYAMVQPFTAYIDRALFNKLSTASGIERMNWNVHAFQNFLDTGFMGAGLGSMRASNWLLACLGSIGVIGTALFLGFLAKVAQLPLPPDGDARKPVIEGLKAGCLAMFISAMLTAPTPDLGLFFFALAAMAAGLSRGAALESQLA